MGFSSIDPGTVWQAPSSCMLYVFLPQDFSHLAGSTGHSRVCFPETWEKHMPLGATLEWLGDWSKHITFSSFLQCWLCFISMKAFREFPGQETTASLIADSLTHLLFILSSASRLYPWLHTLRSHRHVCDQTLSSTFFLEQFKLRCL